MPSCAAVWHNPALTMTIRSRFWLTPLLVLAAFVLQTADLTARVPWLDEGYTLMRIFGSWSDLLTNTVRVNGVRTTDVNPQLYFALAKLWVSAAGSTEFALRLFSAYLGVLGVPLVYRAARATAGARAALLAAALALLSPLLAWYSRELRMYSLVVCLAAASLWCLQRALRAGGRAWWFWALVAALSILTHYSFAGLVAAQALFAMIALQRRGRISARRVVNGLVMGAVALGLVAVIIDAPALIGRLFTGAEYSYDFKPLNDVVGTMASGTLFGVNLADPSNGWLSWAFLALWLAFAVLSIAKARARGGMALLVLSAVAPLLIWFALSLIKPNFHGPRHLMLILPAVWIVFAAGATALAESGALGRVAGGLSALALLVLNGLGLSAALPRAPGLHDDWRAMARDIRAHYVEGDVVLVNAGTPREVLHSYLGALPVPVNSTAQFGKRCRAGCVCAQCRAGLVCQHRRRRLPRRARNRLA